jgi:hypothetical protein
MCAGGERRHPHRLVHRVRRQDFDEVEVEALEILKVANRAPGCSAARRARNYGVCVAKRGNLSLRVTEVAVQTKIKDAPKADKAHA